MTLRLGLPSKGRLQEEAIRWFAVRGVDIARSASEREYRGSIAGIDGIELQLLSASEIRPRSRVAACISA
jgi:ATP phosphoribosyltransferase